MTRREKENRMIEAIKDWDLDSLIDYAEYKMGCAFKTMTAKEIDLEYENQGFPSDDS